MCLDGLGAQRPRRVAGVELGDVLGQVGLSGDGDGVRVIRVSVAVDDTAVTLEDTPRVLATATLLENDTDADNDTLAVTAVGNATNGTVALAGSDVTFIPNANFNGTATFEYTVSDGAATDMALGLWLVVAARAAA